MIRQMLHDLAHVLHVIGIALVVSAVLGNHAWISRAIHVIGRASERRNAACDEHFS